MCKKTIRDVDVAGKRVLVRMGCNRASVRRRSLTSVAAILALVALAVLVLACTSGEPEVEFVESSGRASEQTEPPPDRCRTPDPGEQIGDADGDCVAELHDNCPGFPNPDQVDTDRDIATDIELYQEGDACDDDIDGDRVENDKDRYPRDTDNDGADNAEEEDDDGDGVDDVDDNCPLVSDSTQVDTDDDGGGDKCDADDDDDGVGDVFELGVAGSDPLDPDNTPEYVGAGNVCEDGRDNDLDGQVDGADELCRDTDGDGHPDSRDDCPLIENRDQFDPDEDGLGAECDPDNDNDGVLDEVDECPDLAIDEEKDPGVDAGGCSEEERRRDFP